MRRGRPTKPATVRVSATLAIRVTDAEADHICREAARLKMSVSSYLRARLLQSSQPEPPNLAAERIFVTETR